MKNTQNILLMLFITVLIVIGCEDKPLPFEPINSTNENSSLSKEAWVRESGFFIEKMASKFIGQAQDKIDKAQEKADNATVDVSAVYIKIQEAIDMLQEAKDAYDLLPDPDYGSAIDLAKAAKELASEALDMLEDILDDD